MKDWHIFRGLKETLPEAPPWRRFAGEVLKAKDPTRQLLPAPNLQDERRGRLYQADDTEIEMVNAALVLRRPLLVTGKPGTGKSSLAYAVAHDLGLGPVLRWSITSRATLTRVAVPAGRPRDHDRPSTVAASDNGARRPDTR